jgi:hypothetical protein
VTARTGLESTRRKTSESVSEFSNDDVMKVLMQIVQFANKTGLAYRENWNSKLTREKTE